MWESCCSRRRSIFAREIPPSSPLDLHAEAARASGEPRKPPMQSFGKKRAVTRRIQLWQHNSAIPDIFLREISPNIFLGGRANGISRGAVIMVEEQQWNAGRAINLRPNRQITPDLHFIVKEAAAAATSTTQHSREQCRCRCRLKKRIFPLGAPICAWGHEVVVGQQ